MSVTVYCAPRPQSTQQRHIRGVFQSCSSVGLDIKIICNHEFWSTLWRISRLSLCLCGFSVELGVNKCHQLRPTRYADNEAADKCVPGMSQRFRPSDPRWSLNHRGLDLLIEVIWVTQRQTNFLRPCWTLNWQSRLSVYDCWTVTLVMLFVLKRLTHTYTETHTLPDILKNLNYKNQLYRCDVTQMAIL